MINKALKTEETYKNLDCLLIYYIFLYIISHIVLYFQKQKNSRLLKLQTLRVLLINELLDAKALNSGGSVTLDIPCDLPNSENMHVKFSKIGPKDGARACDFTNLRSKHNDDYSYRRLSNRSSDMSTVNSIIRSRNAQLLIAIFFTAITFQVPFHFLGPKEGYVHTYMTDSIQVNKQYSLFPCTFLLFNSMVVIASVIMTLFLLHEFPFKPWPQISVLALFGSYMCSIKAISPNGARLCSSYQFPFRYWQLLENFMALQDTILREHSQVCVKKTYIQFLVNNVL